MPSVARQAPRSRKQEAGSRNAADANNPPPAARFYLQTISISLPRSVHERLGDAAIEQGSTRTALILTAVNATHQTLGAALANESDLATDELFVIPQNRQRAEPTVETTIRVTDSQLGALQKLVADHSTTRSKLITTALLLHLG